MCKLIVWRTSSELAGHSTNVPVAWQSASVTVSQVRQAGTLPSGGAIYSACHINKYNCDETPKEVKDNFKQNGHKQSRARRNASIKRSFLHEVCFCCVVFSCIYSWSSTTLNCEKWLSRSVHVWSTHQSVLIRQLMMHVLVAVIAHVRRENKIH